LAKVFEASLNNFWHAQPSQIYRELNRMEDCGWVSSRDVIQKKRPNKRVYSITEEGERELAEWLEADLPPAENPHNPVLLRVFFGANAPEATLELLKSYREQLETSQERIEKVHGAIQFYASAVPGGEKARPYWEMTFQFGVLRLNAAKQWVDECIGRLEGIE